MEILIPILIPMLLVAWSTSGVVLFKWWNNRMGVPHINDNIVLLFGCAMLGPITFIVGYFVFRD